MSRILIDDWFQLGMSCVGSDQSTNCFNAPFKKWRMPSKIAIKESVLFWKKCFEVIQIIVQLDSLSFFKEPTRPLFSFFKHKLLLQEKRRYWLLAVPKGNNQNLVIFAASALSCSERGLSRAASEGSLVQRARALSHAASASAHFSVTKFCQYL